ncbi:MAG: ABC transporter substrate-binding protein [Chloroflexi bacterium]|nr:ABC transporter substrate-binding protein [Chloroflexota bacterium]
MRHSKVLGVALPLLVVLSLLLSACGGTQATPAPAKDSQPAQSAKPAAEKPKTEPTKPAAAKAEATKPAAKPTAAAGQAGAAKPAAKAPAGEPVKIGAVVPFTGRYAPLGEPIKKALELAQEKINSEGGVAGRPMQFIIYDDEADQAKSTQLADKLISQDKVVAIIGPIPTANAQAVSVIAERARVPELYANPTSAIWQGKKYIFEINHDDSMQAQAVINYLSKKLGKKSIGILHDANPYGTNGAQVVKQLAEKAGLKVATVEKYAGEDRDVTPQLTKIKNSGAEALVLWGVNPVPAIAAKQLRQLGSSIPVIGSDALYSPVFIELAGEASEGVNSVTALNTDKPDAEETVLVNLYKAKYNSLPPVFAGMGWDAAFIFKGAIEKAGGKTDPDSIVQGMIGLDFAGTMGKRKFTAQDHNGLNADSLVIAQVKGGKWVMLSN